MREDAAHVLEAHESLIERYLEQIEQSEEVGERVRLLREMASILADHDRTLAYEALETAFELDIHDDALKGGQRVAVIDDLIATGGTAVAAAHLVEALGAAVAGFAFVIELTSLKGRERIGAYDSSALLAYE